MAPSGSRRRKRRSIACTAPAVLATTALIACGPDPRAPFPSRVPNRTISSTEAPDARRSLLFAGGSSVTFVAQIASADRATYVAIS